MNEKAMLLYKLIGMYKFFFSGSRKL